MVDIRRIPGGSLPLLRWYQLSTLFHPLFLECTVIHSGGLNANFSKYFDFLPHNIKEKSVHSEKKQMKRGWYQQRRSRDHTDIRQLSTWYPGGIYNIRPKNEKTAQMELTVVGSNQRNYKFLWVKLSKPFTRAKRLVLANLKTL